MDDREFQVWQQERSLLVSRLWIFLLAGSILIGAYIYAQDPLIQTAIAVVGIISSTFAWLNFRKLPQRLDRFEADLDSHIKKKLGNKGKHIKGRTMLAWVVPWVLFSIWAFFLWRVLTL